MMKLYACLSFVAAGAAFVILDEQMTAQLPSAGRHLPAPVEGLFDALESLVRSAEAVYPEDEDLSSSIAFGLDHDLFNPSVDVDDGGFPHPPHHSHRGGHSRAEQTIYELIAGYEHTRKLTALLDDYPDIIELLNSTDAKHTVFVPLDHAFEHMPEDKKPSKEEIKEILKYHIVIGSYPTRRLLGTHTVPTLHDEELLGGKPQRLRTRLGLSGLRVNFYNLVVDRDIEATNGYIHAVKRIIHPPFLVHKTLSFAPTIFSTLLHAYEKTDFAEYIHQVPMNGSTVFAPSNHAFEKLGMAVNAFLFNTPRGLKYLKAILQYHIATNVTLYTDAMYDNLVQQTEVERPHSKHYHVELQTLLEKKSIAVDIYRFHLLHCIKVNLDTSVEASDVVSKNGVIHVVPRVLFPNRHPPDAPHELGDEEMTVEELIKIMSPYVEEHTDSVRSQDL